ncbi:putative membrane protein [Microlunatus panaciterrae]|uniref:Membrane protein n=1 Tax=Microlunatus panaciterrae TaxID=400768 RepID=A0ABS2RKU5_9ACTN|nr:putative membrane protein [Microlunatus panaciterrae]
MSPSSETGQTDRRWPRHVFGVGDEPDPRFSFANERTFLAWIRTALALVAAGVGVAAISQLNHSLTLEVHVASLVLVICGLAAGVGAFTRWARHERAIRLNQALPSSPLMPFLTVGVTIVALIAFVVLLS